MQMLMSKTSFSIQTYSVDPDQTATLNGPADDTADGGLAAKELVYFQGSIF